MRRLTGCRRSACPRTARKRPELAHLAAQYEAVRLFVDRAATIRPDFALTDANTDAVVQIVRRLDGVPLALELAAARVRALSVDQIAARLDDRFRLLTGGSRTPAASPADPARPDRLELGSAIPEEKLLFRRLAVFVGGWTLEAAEFVCGMASEPSSVLPKCSVGCPRVLDPSGR